MEDKRRDELALLGLLTEVSKFSNNKIINGFIVFNSIWCRIHEDAVILELEVGGSRFESRINLKDISNGKKVSDFVVELVQDVISEVYKS